MPIAGIYGPDDFGNRRQACPPRHRAAASARRARPRAADAVAGMDAGGRARHRASL